jgi:hypothetical protein
LSWYYSPIGGPNYGTDQHTNYETSNGCAHPDTFPHSIWTTHTSSDSDFSDSRAECSTDWCANVGAIRGTNTKTYHGPHHRPHHAIPFSTSRCTNSDPHNVQAVSLTRLAANFLSDYSPNQCTDGCAHRQPKHELAVAETRVAHAAASDTTSVRNAHVWPRLANIHSHCDCRRQCGANDGSNRDECRGGW